MTGPPGARVRVSAPGKLLLAGEYAVLTGAPCLVAAVSRRARLELGVPSGGPANGSPDGSAGSPEWGPASAEALLARREAEQRLGPTVGDMRIDVSELRQDGRKLGLGSSAAAAAAAAGAVFAWHGRDLSAPEVRREVLALAMAGHRAVAPEGSGADVAAATLGGVVRFRREGHAFEATPVAWPETLPVRVVWTGAEARTSDLVALVRALAEADPRSHRMAMDAIAEAAEAMAEASARADAPGLVAAAEAHGRAMADLGQRAGAPIVEARLAAVADLARGAGGAAKPSGAGGGDVALAFFPDDDAARQFEEACSGRSLTLLSLALGSEGVRGEEMERW